MKYVLYELERKICVDSVCGDFDDRHVEVSLYQMLLRKEI